MESVSRPPHRRKHSATTNAFSSSTFSFKNPYDDVLLSNGGERKSLEAHEYTEIFSGPSAIPVLDLSGLDERVGSDDPRSSKLDYSNIFGGLRNDDVAVPYHELFNGSAKKIKPRISSDTSSPLQESSSLHSSGKTKTSSAEASDQSVDGVKQQFNLSFNRTSQRNSDAPNGKTHIAELHAVPGFTYFVDGGNPQLRKTENDRRAPSLKREVSRTWSFAAEVEAVKGKGGLSPEKSHTPDNKSHDVNEVNLKSSFPSRISDSENPRKSSASNFSSVEDASEKVVGESSPPFFGEEFDENSVAALSAAALKKAIDQAQESIRIAKMIMEKKKEGFQDGHKRRPKSHVKVLKKETKIYRDAYGSEENNAKEQFEELNPGVTGNDGKSNQSLHHNEKFLNAANVDMERVWENVGTAKEHGETFARGGKPFASDCSRSKTVYIDERVEVKNLEEDVYAAETHREVSNNSSKETLEVVEIIGDNKKGSNVVAEQVEMSAEEAEQCEDTFDHAEGSENRVERVLDASHKTREQEKVVDEAGEKLRICQVGEVSDQRVNDVDDKGKCEIDDCEEMLNVEDLTVLRSKFDSFMDESCNRFVNRILEQEDTEKKSESVFESKEDGITHGIIYDEEGMMQEEAPICDESEEQVRDALEEEINERKAHAFAEIGEAEKKVNEAYEPEIDNKKQNHVHDGDGRNLPGQLEQNTSEYGEAEPIVMEAKNYADIKSAEELDNNLRTQIQESADKDDIDEAIDVNSSGASTIFNDTHTTDASSIFNTNEAEQYQKAVKNHKENDTSPDIIGTFAATDKDYESEQPSHLQDNEMPGRNALNRSASGEIFVESVDNAFEGLSVDGKIANTEGKPAEDDNAFKTTSKIHDASQEYDAKIIKQNLPEVHASDIGTAEFDRKDVRKVLEQTSETNEESLSTFNLENIDGLSAHEPKECAENAEDKTSNKEGLEDEIEMVFNERKCDEEQSVESYPHLHTEPKETEKSTEAARAAERDLNMENNKEDLLANERNDHLQRIEAIKKGREREKDRLVVERAIREARERAFAEARERAERAAVEKATAEVRQRVLAEAREKFEKSSVKQTVDKASTEAKHRAERAAVERATAEARSRALEKAMSQKTYTEARTPSSSGSNGLKHSFSSSDLENGANTESAQRRKARLERHQRIMERAAKALEEKNMRDLLVQKEQAERDRLSESLNADIKRWAAGKEGNLRALLSTLQYILGPDSSWQPISLTEIITTAAVKKAYRKATLYVHPDKLQQRGATIQQKYICEKVFDLLKAAWNRFNSDER